MKKRVVTLALVIALLATCFAGTYAYLTDKDEAVNVMTLGNVKIDQHEYEREKKDGAFVVNDGSYVLTDYVNDKALHPAIVPNGGTVGGITWNYDATPVKMAQVDSYGTASVFNTPNAVDKFVTVENTGKTNAYVRTIIAFEVGSAEIDSAEFPNEPLISSEIRAMVAEKNTEGKQPWSIGFCDYVAIDGNNFLVYELIYTGAKLSDGSWRHENGVLPAGDTTYPSLCQVFITHNATNDDMDALDGNNNGKLDILVLSQAVQADGFTDAKTALDTAFGEINYWNLTDWFVA